MQIRPRKYVKILITSTHHLQEEQAQGRANIARLKTVMITPWTQTSRTLVEETALLHLPASQEVRAMYSVGWSCMGAITGVCFSKRCVEKHGCTSSF